MAKGKIKRTEPEDLDDLVFKALAGKDRRRILDLLRDAPMTTGEIGKNLPHLDRTTVMQHLGVLENARLIFRKSRAAAAGTISMSDRYSEFMNAGFRPMQPLRRCCSVSFRRISKPADQNPFCSTNILRRVSASSWFFQAS